MENIFLGYLCDCNQKIYRTCKSCIYAHFVDEITMKLEFEPHLFLSKTLHLEFCFFNKVLVIKDVQYHYNLIV